MTNEAKQLIAKLHPLERKILPYTAQISAFHELVSVSGLQEVEVMRALQWLQNKALLVLKETIQEIVELDKNGVLYLEKGLPEKRFLKALEGASAISISAVQHNSGLDQNEMTICMGLLKRRNAVTLTKEGNELLVSLTPEGQHLFKKPTEEELFLQSLTMPRDIKELSPAEKKIFAELTQRKSLVKTTVVKLRSVTLTPLGQEVLTYDLNKEFVEQLTPEILQSGTWKNHEFRHYDVSINVPAISGGKQHIVTQAISYIKQIWLDMGFVEMSGPLLQTSYWDLDSLFVPQDHPARQMQDTFFIKDETGKAIALGKLPADFAKIKEIHESGAKTGSTGWKTPWKEEDARKVLLRTHTTVLSALKLAELGQDPKTLQKKLPLKFFNVGRVFRNEALDWKHLFEFHQVDGIVIDPDANMKNLKAYLRQFFGKMGYSKIRIRPAYFPYTEPSMEVEVWHPKKNQWVELGGAGIFRPEVVVPLLGADIPVLAWGLG
ncbi:MAG: phenylalanine--tRNA ligase subunit alpha, partial [Nanoarchaeota archaeon]